MGPFPTMNFHIYNNALCFTTGKTTITNCFIKYNNDSKEFV